MTRAARPRAAVIAALLGLSTLACAGRVGPAVAPPAAVAVMEGSVRDVEGGPVEGAQVFVADESAGALTDERGVYRFQLPVPGTYLVMAVRDGFTRDSVTVTVDAPARVWADFVLGEAPPCQGPCLDRLGNPIACC